MTKHKFDLVVLGTGPAGNNVTYKCKEAGLSVAVIESGSPGGTCSQTGCDAKKPLVNTAEILDWFNRMQGKGIEGKGYIDWQKLIEFKRVFTKPIPGDTRDKLTRNKIHLFEGKPKFVDENTFQVGEEIISARWIVIATGARTKELNIQGEEMVLTSDQFMELDKLPEDIVFIGGGYVSFEFAHVAARAGADVTIIEKNERMLENFDQDLVRLLIKSSEASGIEVEKGKCVDCVRKVNEKFLAECNKGRNIFEADILVHGAGRIPNVDGLDLSKANIEFGPDGIHVNEYLQSVSNPAVYSAGDVSATDGLPLTPVATLEGAIVASNILENNSKTVDYTGVSTSLFTVPALVSVGLTEKQAEEKGLDVTVNYENTSDKKLYQQLGAEYSAYKVLVDNKTEDIVGAHILGPDAYEVINIFAIAMRAGLNSNDLKKAVLAYPSKISTVKWML
ncbi:NAD(P)/FAD-dependent oxidoreductase [Candidatus Poribacteria bacterium]|nr:NAD(P)/FAD-dependent oxidoreductase [Candidatus Poribacteria bacterium]